MLVRSRVFWRNLDVEERFYGVLVDSEIPASETLSATPTVIGYPITADDCRPRFTGRSPRHVAAGMTTVGFPGGGHVARRREKI